MYQNRNKRLLLLLLMSIGFAAFSRCLNRMSEIQIVDSIHDVPPVKKIKSIIEGMTYFSPNARISASKVLERISLLTREVRMTNLLLPRQLIYCWISSKVVDILHFKGGGIA